MRQDTRIVNGIGVNYVVLLYIEDIREMFGDDTLETTDVTVSVTNGDWDPAQYVVRGSSWQETQLLVHLDNNLGSGLPIRINSTITVKQ